jgi:hypothetical protein
MKEPNIPAAKVGVIDDELMEPTEEQTAYLRRQGNQYAKLSVLLPEETAGSATAGQSYNSKSTASKEEFDAYCRKIFGFYIPAAEKGRLRPHHRNFINRNQARSPAGRYKIMQLLKRYEFSSHSAMEAQFNRERPELTESKLREIERAVDADE